MKLKPYKEYLKMAKEAVDDVLAPVRSARAKAQAQLEIAKLDEAIASKEAKIQERCTEKELDFSKLIDEQDQLALQVRRRKQFVKLIDELFPD